MSAPRSAAEQRAACERGLAALEELGAVVEPVADDFASTEPIWLILTQSFWNARFRRYVPEFGDRMSETLLRHTSVPLRYTLAASSRTMRASRRVIAEGSLT